MTYPKELPENLQLRYGVRRSRLFPIIVGVLIAGVVAGGTAFASFRQQNPSVSSQLLTFDVASESLVNITWEVKRGAGSTTYCVVRAQDIRRTDVGYATVLIAPGAAYEQVSYPLVTNGQAVLAELLGCSANKKMRVPPANFPPGVKIPEQPAPGVAPKAS